MAQLLVIFLVALYVFGVWKFIAGFRNTSFQSNRISLALLWPVLLVMNGNYRTNFFKALKG
ncbi:MAG: hypothetical protein ACK456_05055 [Pseudanabaenaceae cyanobacterium]|jgi:hypothetical protein